MAQTNISAVAVFRPKMRPVWGFLWLAFFGLVVLGLMYAGAHDYGFARLGPLIPIVLGVYALVAALMLTSVSDIVLSDAGISRWLFGSVWATIEWKNVRLITSFPVSPGRGKLQRGFNIFPNVRPRMRLTPSGKFWFSNQVENGSELVRRLNEYALLHRIPMQGRTDLFSPLVPIKTL
jgi:hypothetical protein